MGMGVSGGGGSQIASINMTPMIDVLLVLLIIFMVITPLTPKGLRRWYLSRHRRTRPRTTPRTARSWFS